VKSLLQAILEAGERGAHAFQLRALGVAQNPMAALAQISLAAIPSSG
jgi:hypothetical protein